MPLQNHRLDRDRPSDRRSMDRNVDAGERKRKRRKLLAEGPPPPPPSFSRWRTEAEHWIYSSRLLEALRRVRRSSSSSSSSVPVRGRAVREAADRTLAFAARGRTRWSRAILLRRASARLKAAARRRPQKPPPSAPSHSFPGNPGPASPFQRKDKVLGSLIPGCRKLPFPALLDETFDYITALQMQVKAMTALADALSAAEPSRSASALPRL